MGGLGFLRMAQRFGFRGNRKGALPILGCTEYLETHEEVEWAASQLAVTPRERKKWQLLPNPLGWWQIQGNSADFCMYLPRHVFWHARSLNSEHPHLGDAGRKAPGRSQDARLCQGGRSEESLEGTTSLRKPPRHPVQKPFLTRAQSYTHLPRFSPASLGFHGLDVTKAPFRSGPAGLFQVSAGPRENFLCHESVSLWNPKVFMATPQTAWTGHGALPWRK